MSWGFTMKERTNDDEQLIFKSIVGIDKDDVSG